MAAVLIEAAKLFLDHIRDQRVMDRKRKEFTKFQGRNLNYPLIEQIVAAAAKQNPGFYSVIKFNNEVSWEFGIKAKEQRSVGETF